RQISIVFFPAAALWYTGPEEEPEMVFTHEAYAHRPTRAEISLSALIHNYRIVRSLIGPDVKLMAMVKANAYGHGIVRVSKELLAAGADCLGVAYLEEAVFLRENGIRAPIVVMGAINSEQIPQFIEHDIEITSSSPEKSRAIAAAAKGLGTTAVVHLKIDTGMERIGVHWYNAERFIGETLELDGLKVKGVFSHLAKAECDAAFTETQIGRFDAIVEAMAKNGTLPEQVHLANSAGIINFKKAHYTMVRPGIMLYGYDPMGYRPGALFNGEALRPVMTLKTKVSFFKVCPAGTGISYGHTYITQRQTRVVTLPVGYGDGYSRLLSNRAEILVRGRRYPVAGTVCMDQTMVDIGPDGTAYNGDDVLLFGEMDGTAIPLEELCEKIGTITYEMLCGISSRVPRVYVE
ncbi:MAG: alanine racemase, partial [Propionibacterium sp.]|nr:alanine racemase [Propionibacterium sp.]